MASQQYVARDKIKNIQTTLALAIVLQAVPQVSEGLLIE